MPSLNKTLGFARDTDPNAVPWLLMLLRVRLVSPSSHTYSAAVLARLCCWPENLCGLSSKILSATERYSVKPCTTAEAVCPGQSRLPSLMKMVVRVNRAQLTVLASLPGYDSPLAPSLSLNAKYSMEPGCLAMIFSPSVYIRKKDCTCTSC